MIADAHELDDNNDPSLISTYERGILDPTLGLGDFALENGTIGRPPQEREEDNQVFPWEDANRDIHQWTGNKQESVHPLVREHLERLACLVYPTALLSALCIFIVSIFDIPTTGAEPFVSLLPYPYTPQNASVAIQVWHANANALAIMAVVVFLTYLFVGMFRFRMRLWMHVCVIASFAICWGGFLGYVIAVLSGVVDYITMVICSVNFSVAGVFAVFVVEDDAWPLGNFYLIATGAILAWPFACLPELTILFFLAWMAIWDIIAVCTPCGPLRYALYIQQQRIWLAESEFVLPRGMVIRLNLYELGLGDLIFFGVIVARAASVGYETTVACVCGMLAAVVLTVLATVVSGQTIPALPIAMLIGISVYVGSRFTLAEFCYTFAIGTATV